MIAPIFATLGVILIAVSYVLIIDARIKKILLMQRLIYNLSQDLLNVTNSLHTHSFEQEQDIHSIMLRFDHFGTKGIN